MNRIHLFVLPLLLSVSAFAANYKTLDLVKEFPKENRVEMIGYDGLTVNLGATYSIYHVEAAHGPLAECAVLEFSESNKRTTISFEPELDDGMNSCTVTLYARNGSKFNLVLFVDVNN